MIKNAAASILCIISLAGCTIFSVTPSAKRDSVPKVLALSRSVTLTATGAVHIKLIGLVDDDLVPASFLLNAPGVIAYIDPVCIDKPVPADYIFITHDHGDHLSIPDIRKLTNDRTLIVCPVLVAKELKGFWVKAVHPGDVIALRGVICETVAAYSVKPIVLGSPTHPKSAGHTGFILRTAGVSFYFPGDTAVIPEMASLSNITLMCVPLEGDSLGLMSTAEAAALVNRVRPKMAVPMHYGIGRSYSNTVERFRKAVDKGIDVVTVQGRS